MDSGFYSAFAGFSTRMDALDILANNLANVSTVAYKSQSEFYRSLNAALNGSGDTGVVPASLHSLLNQSINRFGVLGGTRLDLGQGTLEPTGNDTDLALEGSGFFVVQTRNGLRYTRNGSLSLNKDRLLVTQEGDPVLSQQSAGRNQPIQIPSGKFSISPDGTISSDGALVAKLRIEDFAPGTDLQREGNSYYTAPPDAAKPSTATVRQGMLEASNADAVRSTVALMDLQRTAQLMERALSIFHNEFNRTAAQDLPRV